MGLNMRLRSDMYLKLDNGHQAEVGHVRGVEHEAEVEAKLR